MQVKRRERFPCGVLTGGIAVWPIMGRWLVGDGWLYINFVVVFFVFLKYR
jgi:hypothetical protein